MGKVVSEAGDKAQMMLIYGADFETIERYIDRQNGIRREIGDCNIAFEGMLDYKAVSINGSFIRLFDHTRPMMIDFLKATALELEQQAREMPLVVRIGEEESDEEEKDDEWDAMAVL